MCNKKLTAPQNQYFSRNGVYDILGEERLIPSAYFPLNDGAVSNL